MTSFILLAVFTLSLVSADDDPTIRFIIEIVHHGARSSPVNNFDISKVPWDVNHKHGELTNVGLREGYLLGRTLREKYMRKASIINEKYDDYQVLIKSAPYNAAVMSGVAQMMGFYTPGVGDTLTTMEQVIAMPPVEDLSIVQKEADDLRDAGLPYYTQVLPVKTFEGNMDWLFSSLSQCNIIKQYWANISSSSEYLYLEQKYKQLYKDINSEAEKAGVIMNITNMTMAYLLYDDLKCDIADDRSFSNNLNFSADVMAELDSLACDTWKFLILGDSQIMKAVVTPLYREWITLLNNVVKDDNRNMKVDNTLNLALYVADASLMLPIMNLFGKSYDKPFEFADNIIIQMGVKLSSVGKAVKQLNDYEIVASFDGNTITMGREIWIDAQEFVRMLNTHSLVHISQGQFEEWCDTPPYIPPVNPEPVVPTVPKFWNVLAIIIEVVFLLLIVVTCIFVNRKKPEPVKFEPSDPDVNENRDSSSLKEEAKAL